MASHDFVRYLTEQLVHHLNQPKAERKENRKQRRAYRRPFMNRWFGILPFSMMFFIKRLLKR